MAVVTARVGVRMEAALPEYAVPAFVGSPALRADWSEVAHWGEDGADACTYRHHDEPHPATIRLTPDPDPELVATGSPHTEQLIVCRCCAFQVGHIFEEMANQVRRGGDVEVELRQPNGAWIS